MPYEEYSASSAAQRFALVVGGWDEIHSEDEKKLEARKILDAKRAAESHKSTARFVGLRFKNLDFGFDFS